MQSILHRMAWAVGLGLWGAGAQAVVFDPGTALNTDPMAVVATSALGSITVNANAYYPSAAASTPTTLQGSNLMTGTNSLPMSNLLGADVEAVNGGLSFSPSVSGSLAASYTTPFSSMTYAPSYVANANIQFQTAWTQPATTGLALTVSGQATYLGSPPVVPAGTTPSPYGVTYHLVLTATDTHGKTLTLQDINSSPVLQQPFSYTGWVPAGFDVASLAVSLTGGWVGPDPVVYKGISTSYKVTIDNITLTPAGAVPEPTTLAMMGLGLLGVMAARRRQRQA